MVKFSTTQTFTFDGVTERRPVAWFGTVEIYIQVWDTVSESFTETLVDTLTGSGASPYNTRGLRLRFAPQGGAWYAFEPGVL